MENLSLRLYVSNLTSGLNIKTIKDIHYTFKDYLKCEYKLEVIDLQQSCELAEKDNIIAIPTLLLTNSNKSAVIIDDIGFKS